MFVGKHKNFIETSKKSGQSIENKFLKHIKGPMQILKSLVLICCLVIVVIQVTACLRKLRKPPVTTYTHFDFNDVVHYPAVTICREPSYKHSVMEEYNLYQHPHLTSLFESFDFENHSLNELWKRACYSTDDNVVRATLNGLDENLMINNTYVFSMGQCQTLIPKVELNIASKVNGYSILLNYSSEDMMAPGVELPPGYHIFVHSTEEPFTEVLIHSKSLVEYLFIQVGEEVDVKLSVQQFFKLDIPESPCGTDHFYSASMCTAEHVQKIMDEKFNCSGPWISSALPNCNNSKLTRALISKYVDVISTAYHTSECIPRCASTLYSTHIEKRIPRTTFQVQSMATRYKGSSAVYTLAQLQTQLYIYLSSMMVSVYEETHSYDWNVFVADCGGSLGFLLGISVLGFIGILEKMWHNIIHPMVPKEYTEEDTTSNDTKDDDTYIADFDKKSFDNVSYDAYKTPNKAFLYI